jgi:superfamily II DNA helicase RecQ
MQMRFFTIPVHGGDTAEEALNHFLASHRVLAIDRSFVQDQANSGWSLCVSFEPGESRPQPDGKRLRVDYREVLNEGDFAVFARLRALRKELSDAEGVPPYALFTNEQLAEMVQRVVRTPAAMLEISGIGETRLKKYGRRFLDLLQQDATAAPLQPAVHAT